MDGIQQALDVRLLFRTHRRERTHDGLVLAGRERAVFHPQLLHQSLHTEALHDHADRADQAALGHIDLVGRGRHVIGAAGSHVGDHGIDLLLRMQGTQAPDLVIDIRRLHRTAARAVDAQQHRLAVRRLEGRPQPLHDLGRIRLGAVGNLAAHVDHGRVFGRNGRTANAAATQHQPEQQDEVGEGEQLEEHPPAPRPALLLQRGHDHLFQDVPFATARRGRGRGTAPGIISHCIAP